MAAILEKRKKIWTTVSIKPHQGLVLTPQLAMPSLFFAPKCDNWSNVLFSMFPPDGIIRSYGSGYFNVFGDCFWFIFPTNFLILEYQSFCRCARGLLYKLLCHCVYSCSDICFFRVQSLSLTYCSIC